MGHLHPPAPLKPLSFITLSTKVLYSEGFLNKIMDFHPPRQISGYATVLVCALLFFWSALTFVIAKFQESKKCNVHVSLVE
jgi:hypothetical protein